MKNAIKFVGIIALVAVIGFSMAACGDEDEKDNNGGDEKPISFRKEFMPNLGS
jgi:hypothetical protein